MNKAVVLGCNYYIGLSMIRCLGKEGVNVVACDYDFETAYGAKSKYISEFLHVEGLSKIDQHALDQLVAYGKQQTEKPVLLPSHDKYVEFIDTFYDELSQYYLISQAENGLNSIVMDKVQLHKLATKHGVRVPTTITIDDPDLYQKVEEIGFPCIIKPSDTVAFTKIFRRKVIFCDTLEDVIVGIERCKQEKVDVFIQQVIPGFDDHMLTYDYYVNRQGKTTHYMTAQKQRQWPINFGASVFTQQKYNKELVDVSKPFLEAIGYRGFGEIEYKKHEKTGDLYLIEINARTTNFNNLIYKLGINMPYIAYLELTGQQDKIEEKFITWDTNRAFVYGFEDMMAIRGYHKTKQVNAFQSIGKLFTKRLAPAIWELDDLGPWFFYNGQLLKKVVKKIKH
ncbi:hypothetical protein SAMN05421767_10316 [Granulicatella balaenopterae]|uniref:ATP-grasp domain-containing protein n=2 Tax=Granulicatella balaenopterae TaxID=137733 RepID=A0A1H9HPN1_9LACT|nr:hypothetical protein SAMN05421767_10316 [Granulicatella balaenopterae]